MKPQATLTVLGVGIKFLSHLTLEAKVHIEKSDKLLYLVNEPLYEEWLKKANSTAESLYPLYISQPRREDSYKAITQYILDQLEKAHNLCVVVYGHPTVFAEPALNAARIASSQNVAVNILPGISAEACLFADLMIDPGSCGCQSFEATDFLVRHRPWDKTSHLILWQIDAIGMLGHDKLQDNKKGMTLLFNYLVQQYNPEYKVALYEAAQYPSVKPKIEWLELKNLVNVECSRISTLYIPPCGNRASDPKMLKDLGIGV